MSINVNKIFRKTLLSKYIQDYDYFSLQRAFKENWKANTSITCFKLNNLFSFKLKTKY